MSEFRPNVPSAGMPPAGKPQAMDSVSQLLRSAGRRPEIDPAIRARVEQAANQAWRIQVARRQRRRWSLALAAGLGLFGVLAGIAQWTQHGVSPAAAIARVERIEGAAWRLDDEGRTAFRLGDVLRTGDKLEVAGGARLALRADTGASVRIDQRSRLRIEDAALLTLETGAVYVDNEGVAGQWLVRTPLIEAHDIGTRFMVTHLSAVGSSVRVRDGLVQVEHGETSRLAGGTRIDVAADGRVSEGPDSIHGADWAWVVEAAMPPDLRGRPVIEFLRWYAHESGLVLHVDADQALALRLDAPLQGSTAGLGAVDWLQVAQLAAEFRLVTDISKGELHVKSTHVQSAR